MRLAAGLGGLLCLCLAAWASAAAGADAPADILYVSDVLILNMRSGPAESAAVLPPSLSSGDALQVLGRDADSGFVQVRTDEGRRGWVHRRYLVETSSAGSRLQAAQERVRALEKAVAAQRAQIRALSAGQAPAGDADGPQAERIAALQAELEHLQGISDDALQTRAANLALTEENAALSEQVKSANLESKRLQAKLGLRWLLAGGGLVVAGLIIGYSIGYRRRRSAWS